MARDFHEHSSPLEEETRLSQGQQEQRQQHHQQQQHQQQQQQQQQQHTTKQEEKLDDSRNDVKAKEEYGWSLNEGGMQAARFLKAATTVTATATTEVAAAAAATATAATAYIACTSHGYLPSISSRSSAATISVGESCGNNNDDDDDDDNNDSTPTTLPTFYFYLS
ncbi:hypothetical protein HZH68_007980 [Vespula germanica]|uniref:Uncharacterized protein n=1 Tax=Vespula germanica TaxID=30212 RepID=A0A834K3D3_VESGE|nr:hypothetical protein HZH68_007980 [Vespula germanica]